MTQERFWKIAKISGIIVVVAAILGYGTLFFFSYRAVGILVERQKNSAAQKADGKISKSESSENPSDDKVSLSTTEANKQSAVKTETVSEKMADDAQRLFDMVTALEDEANLIEEIDKDMQASSAPSLCDVLCGKILFTREYREAHDQEKRSSAQRKMYDYYKEEGRRSFEDPAFLNYFELFSENRYIFPKSIREGLFYEATHGLQNAEMSLLEKISYSARLPWDLAKQMAHISKYSKIWLERVKKVRAAYKMRDLCDTEGVAEAQRRCAEIMPKRVEIED